MPGAAALCVLVGCLMLVQMPNTGQVVLHQPGSECCVEAKTFVDVTFIQGVSAVLQPKHLLT
jgi:hypothetical protein